MRGPWIAPHSHVFSQMRQVVHSDQRLMLEHGGQRDQAERGADRAQEPAVEVAHEHRRHQQHAQADPQQHEVSERPNIQNGST